MAKVLDPEDCQAPLRHQQEELQDNNVKTAPGHIKREEVTYCLGRYRVVLKEFARRIQAMFGNSSLLPTEACVPTNPSAETWYDQQKTGMQQAIYSQERWNLH